VWNRGLLAAWVTGLAVLTWREMQATGGKPVPPGRYAAASGAFVLLGLLATSDRAAPAAALAAWGLDLAAWLQPGVLPGTSTPAQRASIANAGTGPQSAGAGPPVQEV
jgi:hypothetical protein